jgi:hypothetical protein
LGTSWKILEHYGTFWNVLKHFETFWNSMAHLVHERDTVSAMMFAICTTSCSAFLSVLEYYGTLILSFKFQMIRVKKKKIILGLVVNGKRRHLGRQREPVPRGQG